MNISQKQIEAITSLNGEKRYRHFIKVVVDWEVVWSLDDGGLAIAVTDENLKTLPIWPAKEYALLCAKEEWEGYQPKSYQLDYFLDELLPNLKEDGILPAVFMTPQEYGVTPSVDQLISDLKDELCKY